MERSQESSASTATETDLLLPPNPEAPPKDRWLTVYFILYLLGVGCLLPWNFFSNAKQFFMYKFRDTHNTTYGKGFETYFNPNHTTHLQVTFESYLSVAAMAPSIFFLFLNTIAVKSINLKKRMFVAGAIMIVLFIVTLSLVFVDTDMWQNQFFALTLFSIVVMNGASAFLQGGVFGLASMFPGKYTAAIMAGMGMGGTIAAAVNILAIAITDNPLDMGFGYFLTAVIILFLALVGYGMLPLFKFARFYIKKNENARKHRASVNERQKNGSLAEPVPEANNEEVHIVAQSGVRTLFTIVPKLWKFGLSVFIIFTVTLSCYPAINSAILSTASDGKWKTTYFMPVSCFLFFNFFDYFGRTTAGWIEFPACENPNTMLIIAVSRVVFIPLFLLCNVQPRKYLPVVFHSDIAPMVLTMLFGLTNGHFGTLSMVYGPRRIPQADLEMAGSLMSFFIASGLGMGAFISFGLVNLV